MRGLFIGRIAGARHWIAALTRGFFILAGCGLVRFRAPRKTRPPATDGARPFFYTPATGRATSWLDDLSCPLHLLEIDGKVSLYGSSGHFASYGSFFQYTP